MCDKGIERCVLDVEIRRIGDIDSAGAVASTTSGALNALAIPCEVLCDSRPIWVILNTGQLHPPIKPSSLAHIDPKERQNQSCDIYRNSHLLRAPTSIADDLVLDARPARAIGQEDKGARIEGKES